MVNCKIGMSISLLDLVLSKIWRIVSINLNLFKKKEREHFSLCLFRLHQLLQFGCSENFSIRVLGGYVTLTVWSSFDLLSLQHSGQCLRKCKSSRLDLAQVDLNSFSLCLFRLHQLLQFHLASLNSFSISDNSIFCYLKLANKE